MTSLKVLGWLYAALSVVALFAGSGIWVGLLVDGDRKALTALQFIGPLILIAALLICLPALIGGVGLILGWSWARVPVVIASLPLLFAFPFGTVLAVFAFWVLYEDEKRALLAGPPAPVPKRDPAAASAAYARFGAAAQREVANASGVLLAAAGVGAGFIVAIVAGFRFNGQEAPAPLGSLFYAALVTLVLVVGYAAWRWFGARNV